MNPAERSRISFWKGWECAVNRVWKDLTALPGGSLPADQEGFKSALLGVLRPLLPQDDWMKPGVSNATLAKKYAISRRTVTNWRKAGCPFTDGQWRVLAWAVEQRILPAGFRAKFAHRLERRIERRRWRAFADAVAETARAVEEAKLKGLL